jgi:hypothetical protein
MSEDEDKAQPPTHSMTSRKSCFYSGCNESPYWAVASSVKQKNPDGSPLVLLTCDEHYSSLTSQLIKAGTPYSLWPLEEPRREHSSTTQTYEEAYQIYCKTHSWPIRTGLKALVFAVAVLITPFLIIYLGFQWIAGRRPKSGGDSG